MAKNSARVPLTYISSAKYAENKNNTVPKVELNRLTRFLRTENILIAATKYPKRKTIFVDLTKGTPTK